jgi:predicted site-specific integrase-resolvase
MNPIDDCFLSRAEVMRRWRISIATIKRREQQGILRPIRMSTHVIRYRLSDVVRAEDEAAAGREWEERENDQKEQDGGRETA